LKLPDCKASTNDGISSLFTLKHVGSLHLGISVKITSSALEKAIQEMSTLYEIYLHSEGPTYDATELSETFLEILSQKKNLCTIKLTKLRGLSCQQGLNFGNLAKLESLSTIDVSETDFGDMSLQSMCGMTSLTELSCQGCYGVTDEARSAFQELPKLQILNLAKTNVSDLTVKSLESSQIQNLNLGKTKVTNECCGILSQIRSLTDVDLSCKHITSVGLKKLEACTNLTALNLAFSKVTDEGIQLLRQLPCLRYLSLRWTSITDSALEYLAATETIPENNEADANKLSCITT